VLPLFERATDIAIVAAFVQGAGLDRIEQALRCAFRASRSDKNAGWRSGVSGHGDRSEATSL
jgi:hypothetical protein